MCCKMESVENAHLRFRYEYDDLQCKVNVKQFIKGVKTQKVF